MKLNGKSVVVTGASSGMGKSIVELFAREGANIIAVARRRERLDELAEGLKDAPGKVIPYVGDVSREDAMTGAIDLAVQSFGRLDILVNNAGIMDDMSPIGDVKNEKLDQVFAVNVYGPMYAMRKAVQVFLSQGGITTEISTSMGMPNMAGYGRVKNVLATSPAPGTPEQIASAALFLASDDSGYVNGDVLLVDGGWAAG